jgi:hypothetical protein
VGSMGHAPDGQQYVCLLTGELIWQRDTASEVRPALQNAGGLATLGNLIANTSSERIRLKVPDLLNSIVSFQLCAANGAHAALSECSGAALSAWTQLHIVDFAKLGSVLPPAGPGADTPPDV